MKLRSIVLAGLLSASFLTMSGCNTDDIIDAVNDALGTNVVNVANGQNAPVHFDLEGQLDSNDQVVDALANKMFVLNGQDEYNVQVLGEDSTVRTFPKDQAHLYALCDNGGVLTDTSTGGARDIEVINLSNTEIGTNGTNVHVSFYNAANELLVSATINGTVTACAKATLPTVTNLQLSDVKFVEVNNLRYEVPEYNSDIEAKLDELNDVDFDLIVFDPSETDPKGTVVPLATAAQIL